MALTFTQQPSGDLGGNSPLIFQAYDSTNYASAGFYYRFQIFVWSGAKASVPTTPVATIQRLPDSFASYRGMVEVHKIVAQYLEEAYQTYTSTTIGTGGVWCLVKVQTFWTAGSTSAVSSNTIYVTNGYSYTTSGINANFTNSILTDRVSIRLTPSSVKDLLWVDREDIASVVAGAYTHTFSAFTTSSNKYQAVDVVSLLASAGLTGQNTTLTFNLVGGGTTTKSVIYDCTNKYGQTDILYLNRFGVYDTFHFNSLFRDNFTKEVETMFRGMFAQTDLTAFWSNGVPIKSNFNQQVYQQRQLSSGWITESDVEVMMQIFYTRRGFLLEDSSLRAFTISDSAFQRKTANVDKLIEYTLNLDISYPYINTIVR